MSNKRPLSPETSNGYINADVRSMKRLKLHCLIEELRNEEANLVIFKKLRSSQQISLRANNHQPTNSNGFHSTSAAAVAPPPPRPPTSKSNTPIPSSVSSSSRSSLQQVSSTVSIPVATRKATQIPSNPPSMTKTPLSTPIPHAKTNNSTSLEERKAQAKKALRQQLERDLLNIPPPKPLLQDILFVPNPNSLEFQPYIGLEDVVQCLYELQSDRHRLPQRFTDRAQIDEPNVCDHCGTDYTIRWWKHFNTNQSSTNILCDRCKKQVTRRTLKSDHSTLLKNVFVSAMEQEKEIEKNFHTLIKQQQKQQQQNSPLVTNRSASIPSKNLPTSQRPVSSSIPSINFLPSANVKTKTKSSQSIAQNFATKLSQQSTLPGARKSTPANVQSQFNSNHHQQRSNQQTMKTPMPAHHPPVQQQFRSAMNFSTQQQSKNVSMPKMSKNLAAATTRPAFLHANPLIPPTVAAAAAAAMAAALSATAAATPANSRPTATKRRTQQ